MKRFGKLFTMLVVALLVFSVISIFAFAEESAAPADSTAPATQSEKEAISEGKFLFYDASAKTYTEYDNSSFFTRVAALKDGDAIVLLSNLDLENVGYQTKPNQTSRALHT